MNAAPAPPPRVLIVAEHASARFGGEAILPLHYFRVLRKRGVEAWLIVHSRTRDELVALFPNDASRIHFIPDTAWHKFLFRVGKPLPGHLRHFSVGFLSRLSSQRQAKAVARRMIAEHRIHIVHQPMPVSPKESSLLHGLGVPVVIGPMNGGMTYPPGFTHSQGGVTHAFVEVGRLFSGLLNALMPGKLKAAALLVANERTRTALPGNAKAKALTLVENGVDLSIWTPADRASSTGPTRFAFTGRLVDWKGVDLLLEAMAKVVAQVPATLDIFGDGAMRPALQAQAAALGIAQTVTFHGWVAQALCAQQLRTADALVLPSLYECGGAVVLEAMAVGLPVIATNWGGPADYLDETCGILVTPKSRGQFIDDLAAAMIKLAQSPELRSEMGAAGRKKVEAQFDWERKVDAILEIYHQAIKAFGCGQ